MERFYYNFLETDAWYPARMASRLDPIAAVGEDA
jgi:hypothetical protein